MTGPPVLFIHGAANGAWVWDAWRQALARLGRHGIVLDLRGHGRSLPADFSTVTMEDYVADVESVAPQVAERFGVQPVIAGWSMGGLIAMMYAARHPETPGLVLFAPSAPVEVSGRADPEAVRATPTAPFGPELYGIYPGDLERSRPALHDLTDEEARRVLENSTGAEESGFARRQRLRGISVEAGSITCPSLVIYGDSDRSRQARDAPALAEYLHAEMVVAAGAGHWGIVYNEATVDELAPHLDAWLTRCFSVGADNA
jgi:pimeloyl-ACP methyl ester carboxylesterase